MTIIYTHTVAALLAILLGLAIFANRKGTAKHKLMGVIWISLLLVVSLTAMFIQEINPGHFSPIHLLAVLTVGALIYSVWNIRKFKATKIRKYRLAHMYSMIGVYVGGLVLAGVFTLMPGRFLHGLLFG